MARILVFGSGVRVELDPLPEASGRAEPADHYEVILPRERIRALALTEGQRVRLSASRIRVFPRAAA